MSSRRILLAGGVALVVAVAGVVAWRTLRGRDDARGPARREILGAGGGELVALLEKGARSTYRARYRTAPSEGGAGPEMWLEVWHKPPREREDSVVVAGGRTVRSAAFFLPRDAAVCTEDPPGSWRCRGVAPGERRRARSLVDSTIESIGDATVVESRAETIAGQSVRCFTIPVQAQAGQMCVTRGGVLARLAAGGTRIELVELRRDVPEAAFRLPAAVEGR